MLEVVVNGAVVWVRGRGRQEEGLQGSVEQHEQRLPVAALIRVEVDCEQKPYTNVQQRCPTLDAPFCSSVAWSVYSQGGNLLESVEGGSREGACECIPRKLPAGTEREM